MNWSKRTKAIKERIAKEEIETDEMGAAVVRINITDAESLLSVYNDAGKKIISTETAEFIDNVTKPVPARQELHLKISCESYTKDKEHEYKHAISNYYVNEFAHVDMKLKSNLMHSIWFLLIGVVLFTMLFFMEKWNVPYIINLILEVISWVFVWEAVDLLGIRRHFLRLKRQKFLQIIFAKVSFDSLKDKGDLE